nr:hypothetical protein CFP56_29646 [Quercus suber]
MHLATEYQYGEWIRANGNSKGGPKRMKPRKEVHHQPSAWERKVAQPLTEGDAMVSNGGRSRQNDGGSGAEKQVGQGDVCSDGQSGS